MMNKKLGDSSTPSTWRPTSDSIRDERIDNELMRGEEDMNINEKAAEILVACGYATSWCNWSSDKKGDWSVINVIKDKYTAYEDCDPFYSGDRIYKECLSRRQADAIENYLHRNYQHLLIECHDHVQDMSLSEYDGRIKRLKRIKWCIEKLTEQKP